MEMEHVRTKTRKSDRLDIRLDAQTADIIRQLAERDHRGNISQAARALLGRAANLEAVHMVMEDGTARMSVQAT